MTRVSSGSGAHGGTTRGVTSGMARALAQLGYRLAGRSTPAGATRPILRRGAVNLVIGTGSRWTSSWPITPPASVVEEPRGRAMVVTAGRIQALLRTVNLHILDDQVALRAPIVARRSRTAVADRRFPPR